jgi:hypothetical protein
MGPSPPAQAPPSALRVGRESRCQTQQKRVGREVGPRAKQPVKTIGKQAGSAAARRGLPLPPVAFSVPPGDRVLLLLVEFLELFLL